MDQATFTIDGDKFSNYKEFVDEFAVKVFGDFAAWGGGLDSLNDLLRGGDEIPKGPVTIHWLNSHKSREDLGHAAKLAWLEKLKEQKIIHPTSIERVDTEIQLLKQKHGETLFEMLVNLIVGHKNITLILD